MRSFLCWLTVAAYLVPVTRAEERSWGPYRGADTSPAISEEDVRAFAAIGGNLPRTH